MPFEIENGVLTQYTEEPGVTEVTVPDGVKAIGEWAFHKCNTLTAVHLPEGVRELRKWAFAEMEHLRTVTLPESLEMIRRTAFFSCKSLTEIILPGSQTVFEDNPFQNCWSMERIEVSAQHAYYQSIDGVVYYEKGTVLRLCPPGKTEITIPEGVKEIYEGAFFSSRIKRLTFPKSLKYIGEKAFESCKCLTELVIPKTLKKVDDDAFNDCTALTSVTLPDTFRKISNKMFYDCTSLTEITIPESVKSIGRCAFEGCTALREIIIPLSVKTIGVDAFERCEQLRVIRMYPDDPAVYRDYGKADRLFLWIEAALSMLRTANYDSDIQPFIKYPFLLLHYLRTRDEALAAYIRGHFTVMMKECIPAGDIVLISELMKTDGFFTAKKMDPLIVHAQEHGQTEIMMLLMNYKNQKFGFGNQKKLEL